MRQRAMPLLTFSVALMALVVAMAARVHADPVSGGGGGASTLSSVLTAGASMGAANVINMANGGGNFIQTADTTVQFTMQTNQFHLSSNSSGNIGAGSAIMSLSDGNHATLVDGAGNSLKTGDQTVSGTGCQINDDGGGVYRFDGKVFFPNDSAERLGSAAKPWSGGSWINNVQGSQSKACSTTTNTPTTFALLSTATDDVAGCSCNFTIKVADGAHHVSSISGSYCPSASNRNGTTTVVGGAAVISVSDPTTYTSLTTTATAITSGTGMALQVTPTWAAGTPTSVTIYYTLITNGNTVITPQ